MIAIPPCRARRQDAGKVQRALPHTFFLGPKTGPIRSSLDLGKIGPKRGPKKRGPKNGTDFSNGRIERDMCQNASSRKRRRREMVAKYFVMNAQCIVAIIQHNRPQDNS